MDGMEGRYAFMLGFCCYFSWFLPGDSSFAGSVVVAYSAAILYGTGFGWTFICLNTVTGHYYGPAGISEGERNDAGARVPFFARRQDIWRQSL